MTSGNSSNDIQLIIGQMVQERIDGRSSSYFVSDSVPVNKAAVRTFEGCDDDSFWFPCCVHFGQLAMRENVYIFLNGSSAGHDLDSVNVE